MLLQQKCYTVVQGPSDQMNPKAAVFPTRLCSIRCQLRSLKANRLQRLHGNTSHDILCAMVMSHSSFPAKRSMIILVNPSKGCFGVFRPWQRGYPMLLLAVVGNPAAQNQSLQCQPTLNDNLPPACVQSTKTPGSGSMLVDVRVSAD